jgi:sugar phosphate permease
MEDRGYTLQDLSSSDSAYLLSYTVSMVFSPTIPLPPNQLMALGMTGIAFTSYLKATASSPAVFVSLQVFHAAFQSTGWPTCVRLLSVWMSGDLGVSRGTGMGLWTTCQSIGGVVGALLATSFLASTGDAYTWHVPLLLAWACFCFFYISEEPPGGGEAAAKVQTDVESGSSSPSKAATAPYVTFKAALLLPTVAITASVRRAQARERSERK